MLFFLQDVDREVQPAGRRIEEVGVWQAGVLAPGLLEIDGLVAEAGPSLLQTFPDFGKALLDRKSRQKELHVHRVAANCRTRPNATHLAVIPICDRTVTIPSCGKNGQHVK